MIRQQDCVGFAVCLWKQQASWGAAKVPSSVTTVKVTKVNHLQKFNIPTLCQMYTCNLSCFPFFVVVTVIITFLMVLTVYPTKFAG